MPENNDSTVVLMQFAKWPELGRVKTRLEPALGKEGALRAHVALSCQVLENLSASGYPLRFLWDRALEVAPQTAVTVLDRLRAIGAEQGTQRGKILGSRMVNALAEALDSASKAIIVGSDCPSVDEAYVREAVRSLNTADVVLGPSDDGGYVLIGARRLEPDMLDGVAWGTDQALAQTQARLEAVGLTYALLPPRWDVDEPEDWQRFLAEFPGSY